MNTDHSVSFRADPRPIEPVKKIFPFRIPQNPPIAFSLTGKNFLAIDF